MDWKTPARRRHLSPVAIDRWDVRAFFPAKLNQSSLRLTVIRTTYALNATRLQRLCPWAGLASAVLLVAGFILIGDTPDSTAKEEWVRFYAESGNRLQQIMGGYLGILSAFAFLWFGHTLITGLTVGRGGGDVLTHLARSAATLFAALVILAMLVQVSLSAAIEIGDVAAPDTGDFGIQFEQLAFGILLVAGCMAASLFVATATELARQGALWPRWLIWAGYIAAVLLLFGALFFPLLLIPLWMVAVSVVLLRRDNPPEEVAN